MKKKDLNSRMELPEGWSADQVRELAHHYDTQSEAEAAKEDEAQYKLAQYTMVSVPNDLMPKVRRLLDSANRRPAAVKAARNQEKGQ